MKKHVLTILLFLSFAQQALCQHTEESKRDSLKINSLKKALPNLKESARVDCLNEIFKKYENSPLTGTFAHRTDSMRHYALKANEEALKIRYKYGTALSLLNLAIVGRNPEYKIPKEGEIYIRQALLIAKDLNNDELLGKSYYLLAGIENKEENYKKAVYHFHRSGNIQQETEVTTWLCMLYSDKGEYENGLPYCDKCIQLAKENVKTDSSQWGHELVQWSFLDIAGLYKAAGDYETAMDYLLNGNKYAETKNLDWKMYLEISDLNCVMGKYDMALQFWNKWKEKWSSYTRGHQALGNSILAQIYLHTDQQEKVPPLLKDDILFFKKEGGKFGNSIIRPLLSTGDAYFQMKKNSLALFYANEAVGFAKENNDRPEIADGYLLLSKIHHQVGRNDSAYFYLKNHTALKDSLLNRQFQIRLNNYKKTAEDAKTEARIGFLNKDNKIKEQQLKQEAIVKKSLLAIFITFTFLGIYVFRNLRLKRKNDQLARQQAEDELKVQQLENEKKQSELQQQAAELEMQALRAQMNPHFIFNCLSSINRFILKNESETASDYLTRFSRLIRMVLINSQKSLIPLEDELEMLRLYLDMERLRFKNNFDYTIQYRNSIDAGAIFIPPLLIQPFCENAIWHGLMHKQEDGQLDISIQLEDNVLNCTITDNGVGREKAAEFNSKSAEKEKSMGLKITAARLALLNKDSNIKTTYAIEDLYDQKNACGTKVTVQISYKKPIMELS